MEYTEDMLTEWRTEKPDYPGVYQQLCGFRTAIGFQKWDGEFWYGWCSSKNDAEKRTNPAYKHRGEKWRGLKQNPSAPKKKPSCNKKKTMWIVSVWVNNGETYKHVGAFENHDNAVNAAKRYKQPRINKVRFRTPEA